MKYFIHLAYKGTHYQGWQTQANGLGVQEVVETQLSRVFKQKLSVHACGRTDAGVHARQFFCHTIIEKPWDFDAVFRINKMLPNDIRIYAFIPVAVTANAQLDAVSRTYEYHIHLQENPFLSELSTYYPIQKSAITRMQEAVALLTKYQDFRSFCKQPNLYPHTNCEVRLVSLEVNVDQTQLKFSITANRFLKAMVRLIVGDLVEIGQQKMTVSQFETKLKFPQQPPQYNFAYPQGLYLSNVEYSPILQKHLGKKTTQNSNPLSLPRKH